MLDILGYPLPANMLGGAISAALYGYLHYKKSVKEKFKPSKFWTTVLLGIGLGAIAGYTGRDFHVLANSIIVGYATMIIEDIVKLFRRKVLKKNR